MARRYNYASRQNIDRIRDEILTYVRSQELIGEYENLTGVELLTGLVEAFEELKNDLEAQLRPIQYVLNKLDPEDSETQVLNG